MSPQSSAILIGAKIYDTSCFIASSVWWFTKESTIHTVKLVVPIIIAMSIARGTGMLDLNVRITNYTIRTR
jgi:hypothetical protein